MIILERLLPDRAVIWEDGTERTVPVEAVSCFKEGDVLIRSENGFIYDKESTDKRRREILSLERCLFDD